MVSAPGATGHGLVVRGVDPSESYAVPMEASSDEGFRDTGDPVFMMATAVGKTKCSLKTSLYCAI